MDIKSKIFEILSDQSKYQQFLNYDFLLFISLNDEPFNLYMNDGEGSEEPVNGNQLGELLTMLNRITESDI